MKIHKDGLPNENAGKEYEINSSKVDKESSIRVYAQFIRRYIKSSQVQLKYIKYKGVIFCVKFNHRLRA